MSDLPQSMKGSADTGLWVHKMDDLNASNTEE